jgi:hypothetical protein
MYNESFKAYEKALELDPGFTAAWNNMKCLTEHGKI